MLWHTTVPHRDLGYSVSKMYDEKRYNDLTIMRAVAKSAVLMPNQFPHI